MDSTHHNEKEYIDQDEGDFQVDALYHIGQMYYKESGYSRALPWFQRAAAQNHSDAQYMLGYIHLYGLGVPENNKLAMRWYLEAAANGENQLAQNGIADIYQYGYGFPRDIYKAIKWYKKAASQGYAPAQFSLGCIFEFDIEFTDLQKSVNWYKKAANNGDKNAKKDVRRLAKLGYYPKEEENEVNMEAEQHTPIAFNSVNLENEIANQDVRNRSEPDHSDSALQAFKLNIKSLKEKVKELEETFQVHFGDMEQEYIGIKEMTEERQKILKRQKEKDEEIKKLKETLAKYRTTLEGKEQKIKKIKVGHKLNSEDIGNLKALRDGLRIGKSKTRGSKRTRRLIQK